MNQLLADGTKLIHPRAGELADLACLVEAAKTKARTIRTQQVEHPGYAAKALKMVVDTMNSIVKSELRKLEREMEFPRSDMFLRAVETDNLVLAIEDDISRDAPPANLCPCKLPHCSVCGCCESHPCQGGCVLSPEKVCSRCK